MFTRSPLKLRAALALLALPALCAPVPVRPQEATSGASQIDTRAYDAIERDLLLRIERIEKEHGHVTRELQEPLLELGKLYASGGQCQNAIPILRSAISLSQRLDGVMNTRQLPLFEPLMECYVVREMVRDIERAQEQMLLINESEYGKEDQRMLPALAHAARWYEQAGEYQSARDACARAMKIVRKTGGDQDLRLVGPLRGMARTYRLEMQYGAQSRALEAEGERALERAANIARANPDGDPRERIDTLLELGDWQQMGGAVRDAAQIYKEVWAVAAANDADSAATLFEQPEPILYRAQVGIALRQSPLDRAKLQRYWVDFEFTVTQRGEVTEVVVTDATAPRHLQVGLAESLKKTHYRPRFAAGEAVDTKGLKIRQVVWVGK